VGLVVFARALRGQDPDDYFTQRIQFESTDRAAIRQAATMFALELLQPEKDALRPSEDITLPAP
jgi:nicotinamide-nucleotide amidase